MRFSLLAIVIASSMLSAGAAWSQDDARRGASVIEEIVVTAQKRPQSLQTVPISVTAFTAEEIRRRGIVDVQSLENNTTSFTIDNSFQASQPRLTIRGIGSNEVGAGGDPSSAAFIDGEYLPRVQMVAFDGFDLERIEVLKGPQGTLYGKNVVGGAINVITRKPTDEFELRLQGTVGNEGRFDGRGVINLPISDAVQARLAIARLTNDGFAENRITGQELQDDNSLSARLHLSFDLSESSNLLLTAHGHSDRTSGTVRSVFEVTPETSGLAAFSSPDPDGPFTSTANVPGTDDRETYGVRAELNTELSFASLTGMVAYREVRQDFIEDFDGQRPGETGFNIAIGNTLDGEALSTEWRLASLDTEAALDWVGGLYYLRDEATQVALFGFDLPPILNVLELFDNENETDSYAAFGEAGYRVSDRLRLFGGLRYTREEKDFSISNLRSTGNVLSDEFLQGAVVEDWSELTWRAGAELSLSEELFFYGKISTGFKSGGFQDAPATQLEATTPFGPERATNYEVGLKADWAEGRVRTNAALFFTDFEDLQVAQLSGPVNITTNAAEAEIKGLETDLSFLPVDGLEITLRYAFLDAEFTEFIFEGEDLSGKRLERVPENEVTVGIDYDFPLAGGGRLNLGGSYNWRDEVFDDPDNNPFEERPARTLVDAYLAYEAEDGRWRLEAWSRNLTDELYRTHNANFGGATFVSWGDPRTYGLTFTYVIR